MSKRWIVYGLTAWLVIGCKDESNSDTAGTNSASDPTDSSATDHTDGTGETATDEPTTDEPTDRCAWERLYPEVTTSRLNGVWGSGPDDVYAVGDAETLLHYDGKAWTAVKTPADAVLVGIWGTAANDVYTWGHVEPIAPLGPSSPLALHFDGSAWQDITATIGGGNLEYIDQIFGTGKADVFVRGSEGVHHFDGTAWSVLDTGELTGDDFLFGCGPDSVYQRLTDVDGANFLVHRTGTSWSQEVVDEAQPDLYILAGACAGLSTVYVLGITPDKQERLYRREESGWTEVTFAALAGKTYNRLAGTLDGRVFLHGEINPGSVLAYDGMSWNEIEVGSHVSILGVWSSSTGDALAVGTNGAIFSLDTTSATSLNGDFPGPFVAMLSLPGSVTALVAKAGNLALFDDISGEMTAVLPAPDGAPMVAATAYAGSSGLVYIGGFEPTSPTTFVPALRRYDSAGNTGIVPLSLSEAFACDALTSLTSQDGQTVLGVCLNGDVLSIDGESATSLEAELPYALTDTVLSSIPERANASALYPNAAFYTWVVPPVSGKDPTAAGIIRYDGMTWTNVVLNDQSGYDAFPYAVWGPTADTFFVLAEDNEADPYSLELVGYGYAGNKWTRTVVIDAAHYRAPQNSASPKWAISLGLFASPAMLRLGETVLVPSGAHIVQHDAQGFKVLPDAPAGSAIALAGNSVDHLLAATQEGGLYRRICPVEDGE